MRAVNTGPMCPPPANHSVAGMNLRLALLLGLVALARPVLSVIGAYDAGPLAEPVGPLVMTALSSLAWIAAAVWLKVRQPVLTLAGAGIAYAVFAIVLNWSLQPFLASAERIPLPGYLAMPLVNAAYGAVLGLIALGLQRLIARRAPAAR